MAVVVYIDVLWTVNTYMTWLMLSLTGALTHTGGEPIKRALASAIGGLSSLIILIPARGAMAALVILIKLLSCLLINAVAFFGRSARRIALLSVAFAGANLLVCAAVESVQRLIGANTVVVSGGYIYFDISPVNLILTTAVIYFVICRISAMFSSKLSRAGSYRVEFTLGQKLYSLDGYADTGNNACDLFSGLPVIICTGVEIVPRGFVRAVPYKTVSGEGILYAAAPECLTLTDSDGKKYEAKALVAGLPEAGERRAVFNPKILNS